MAGINTPDDNFNSRPSARGDACEDREAGWREIFQFTPLREGRRQTTSGLRTAENFNSRPSARGDLSMTKPARSSYFNSRPSARGDHGRKARMAECAISIHAPSARGDADKEENSGFFLTFQFTPLREGRRTAALHAAIAALFQFTPLREGRRAYRRCYAPAVYFNSRPSARGDSVKRCNSFPNSLISIHAPPRGATLQIPKGEKKHEYISIHAPPRGATPGRVHPCRTAYFNSRPSARGDWGRWEADCCGRYFNSRPSARGDSPR